VIKLLRRKRGESLNPLLVAMRSRCEQLEKVRYRPLELAALRIEQS